MEYFNFKRLEKLKLSVKPVFKDKIICKANEYFKNGRPFTIYKGKYYFNSDLKVKPEIKSCKDFNDFNYQDTTSLSVYSPHPLRHEILFWGEGYLYKKIYF